MKLAFLPVFMTCLRICFLTITFIALPSLAATGQTVTGSFANKYVSRGSTARGKVVLALPKELHVNSNRPGSEFLIPTVVRISGRGIKAGRVSYPRGHDRKFQFTTKILNVYEGTTVFPFRITVPGNYRGRSLTVNAVVEFQACTEEVCYAPRTETIKISARVR
jgi:hypothetical protein